MLHFKQGSAKLDLGWPTDPTADTCVFFFTTSICPTTGKRPLPDGRQVDYFVWHQTLPRSDPVDTVQSGTTAEDIPVPQDLDALIPTAKSIEIWHDETVHGEVFFWYAVAALRDVQIGSGRVSVCLLPDQRQATQSPGFGFACS